MIMGITILRQYFTYEMTDSYTLNVTQDITMHVKGDPPCMLLPKKGYTADLKITDSEGKGMIILPDHKFEDVAGMPQEHAKNAFLENMDKIDDNAMKQFLKDYRIIAVLFNKPLDDDHEKIRIHWVQKTDIKKHGPLSQHSSILATVPRYGLEHNSRSAIYVSIKSDSKYRILEPPIITDYTGDKPAFISVLDKINHKIYRFKETGDVQLIRIAIKVGMPDAVTKWSHIIAYSTIIVPALLVVFAAFGRSDIPFRFELLAGMIALLFGQRVLILRDTALMDNWSRLNRGLIIWCFLILLLFMLVWPMASTPNQPP